jgi:hypothetical protein
VFKTLFRHATGDGDWTRADGRSTRFWAERRPWLGAAGVYGEDKRINLELLTEGVRRARAAP